MVSDSIDILFLAGYIAVGYLADWGIERYWFWYLDKAIEGREAEGAIGRLAYRVIDKVWWVYFDKVLIRPEAESTSEYRDLAELTDTEADCSEAKMSRLVTEILQKIFVWLSCVLFVGGIGGLLGILLASVFGHQEIFVWPIICLGAVVGGALPFFIPSRKGVDCPDRHCNSKGDLCKGLSQPEVNQTDVFGPGNYNDGGEIAWNLLLDRDLPDLSCKV